MKVINHLLIFSLRMIRPLLGPATCRHKITCGNYAVEQLQQQSTLPALWNILKQLSSCW